MRGIVAQMFYEPWLLFWVTLVVIPCWRLASGAVEPCGDEVSGRISWSCLYNSLQLRPWSALHHSSLIPNTPLVPEEFDLSLLRRCTLVSFRDFDSLDTLDTLLVSTVTDSMALPPLPPWTPQMASRTSWPPSRDVLYLTVPSLSHNEATVVAQSASNSLPHPSSLLSPLPGVQELEGVLAHGVRANEAPIKDHYQREINDLKSARDADHHAIKLVLSLVEGMVPSHGQLNRTIGLIESHSQQLSQLQLAIGLGDVSHTSSDHDTSLRCGQPNRWQQVDEQLRHHEKRMRRLETENRKLQARVSTLETEHRSLKDVHADLFSLRQSVRALEKDHAHRSRLDRIERVIFSKYDQYVECSNLASSIDHAQIKAWFRHCGVRGIFRSGRRHPNLEDVARSVLVWITCSTKASTIDTVMQEHNGTVWDGRQVVLRRIEASVFIKALEEEPGHTSPHNVSPAPTPVPAPAPSHSQSRDSAQIPRARSARPEVPDDTIVVARPDMSLAQTRAPGVGVEPLTVDPPEAHPSQAASPEGGTSELPLDVSPTIVVRPKTTSTHATKRAAASPMLPTSVKRRCRQ